MDLEKILARAKASQRLSAAIRTPHMMAQIHKLLDEEDFHLYYNAFTGRISEDGGP